MGQLQLAWWQGVLAGGWAWASIFRTTRQRDACRVFFLFCCVTMYDGVSVLNSGYSKSNHTRDHFLDVALRIGELSEPRMI